MTSSLAESLSSLPDDDRATALAELDDDRAEALLYDWRFWGRPAQFAPPGGWLWWLILAGRGFGKTRAGAEFIRERVESGAARRIALVAPTSADARDTMVNGPSGIVAISPPWDRPTYEPSKRSLTWKNGAKALLFSAEEPERLRGPQFDTAWCDELGAWKYQRETWDQLQYGFRMGEPQGCITTTPRPTKLMRELVDDVEVRVTRGSTYDNAGNLASAFLRTIRKKYEGTRLGRQELNAELLTDTPGALWTLAQLDELRTRVIVAMKRIVVAVDPAVSTGDDACETGIVVVGLGENDLVYVLDDASGQYSPGEWAAKVKELYDRWQADRVIAEANNGGNLVEANLKTVDAALPVRLVHASRGKRTRAEPVASLYEQGRVRHLGAFPTLEDQMTTWDASGEALSPDRLDALVWGVTALVIDTTPDPIAPATATNLAKRARNLLKRR